MLRPRLATLILAAPTSVACGLTIAPAGQASTPLELVSHASGKCVQPLDGSLGAPIVQETCSTASVAQKWTETSGSSSGTEHFVNRSTQLCVDARGGASYSTPVEQWTCDQISNENWWYGDDSDSFNEELLSRVSGTYHDCLWVPGTQTGAAMILSSCDATISEFFTLSVRVSHGASLVNAGHRIEQG